MPSRPPEADFASDRGRIASPGRMNEFADYMLSRLGALDAARPEWDRAVAELKAIGLSRVTDVLQPIYDTAVEIGAELQTLRDGMATDAFRDQLLVDVKEAVLEAIAQGNLYVRDGANAGLELYSGAVPPNPALAAPGAIYIYVAP